MRLIDADELRHKAEHCIETTDDANSIDIDAYILAKISSNPLFKSLVERVERLERLDLVEVVRCKDCKYNTLGGDKGNSLCELEIPLFQNDDFCSRGERK